MTNTSITMMCSTKIINVMIFVFILMFGYITADKSVVPEMDDHTIPYHRIVKSPWNEDKLSPGKKRTFIESVIKNKSKINN